jgi:methyltransferase (TIGR00027 family)
MNDSRPSQTAAWVAACRGLAGLLPPGEPICDDPWGLRFGGRPGELLTALARRNAKLAWRLIRQAPPIALSLYWVQLRTRALDEMLLRFVAGGGRQILILGAGYDCRALRLADRLAGATVFEVDHPATQKRKREILGATAADGDKAQYVASDFESASLRGLAAQLTALGFDPARPTFTLWEGVTMYLTEAAVSATVEAVRDLSARGSQLAIEYYQRACLARRGRLETLLGRVGIQRREPFTFGWDPPALPGWLNSRGFTLCADETEDIIAARHLPPAGLSAFRKLLGEWRFHLALASRIADEAPRH